MPKTAPSPLTELAADPPGRRGGAPPLIPTFPQEVRDLMVAARRQGHSHRAIAAATTASGYQISAGAVYNWLSSQGVA